MPLLRPRTLTPARLEANRRAAKFATGPKTAEGKARSRMNAARHGERSRLYWELWEAMLSVPPGQFDAEEFAALTPQDVGNPSYARLIEDYRVATDPLAALRNLERLDLRKGAKAAGFFHSFNIAQKNKRSHKKMLEGNLKPPLASTGTSRLLARIQLLRHPLWAENRQAAEAKDPKGHSASPDGKAEAP